MSGEIESPCRKTCSVDRSRRVCLSCRRTFDEIGAWRTMTPAERRSIMDALDGREYA